MPGGIPEAQTFSLLPVREAAPPIAAFAVNTRWAEAGGAAASSSAMVVDGGEGSEGDDEGGAAVDDDGEGGGDASEEAAGGDGGGSWGFGELEGYAEYDPVTGSWHAPQTAGVGPGRLVLVTQGHGRISLMLVLAEGRTILVRQLVRTALG